ATAVTNTGGNFALNLHGTNTTVTNAVTFGTSGAVALGNGSDTLTFTGGLIHTAGSTTLNGNVTTTNTALTLATTTVPGNTTLAAGSGTITLGAATLADGVTLTLGTGGSGAISLSSITGTASGTASNVTFNVTGAVTVSGAIATDIGTITVTNSGGTTFSGAVGTSGGTIASVVLTATTGTIEFSSDLYATAVTNAGGNFALNLHGTNTAVTNAVTFGTSGAVALGNGSDTLTFTGGLVHTAGSTTLAGNVTSSNTDIQLAGITLASNSDVDTTGASAGNILFSSTIATAGFALALDAGPSGNITLSGNLTGGGAMTVRDGNAQAYAALTVGSLNIQDATTSVTFNNNIAATTTVTVASGGTIVLTGN
ncbi:MAG: beta strand repeat-containing protein, partial [Planctomycetaceae bacterium]